MAERPELPEARKPVYVPWSTFTGFLAYNKPKGLPPIVDATAMDPSLGAGMKAQLASGLKFLKLIDDRGRSSPLLRKLVEAWGQPTWGEIVHELVVSAYGDVVRGFELGSASFGMLNDRFAEVYGAHGQVLQKAVRFFLFACKDADMGLSGHLNAKASGGAASAGAASGPRRARRVPRARVSLSPAPPPGDLPPKREGWIKHTYPMRRDLTVEIELPLDLTANDVERLHKWLATLPMNEETRV